MAWYSGVSGACCPGPQGLLVSNRIGPPTTRHWPFKFGYFPTSNNWAPAVEPCITAASAIAAIETLRSIIVPPDTDSETRAPQRLLLSRSLEIPQIRRALAFLGRHQQAIGAEHVILVADHDVIVVLAIFLGPVRLRIWAAAVVLGHRPWPRQRVIEHRDVVMR